MDYSVVRVETLEDQSRVDRFADDHFMTDLPIVRAFGLHLLPPPPSSPPQLIPVESGFCLMAVDAQGSIVGAAINNVDDHDMGPDCPPLVKKILPLLLWYSAPTGGFSTAEQTLGESILRKQDECDGLIGETIIEVLDDDGSDIDDIPMADDSYHDCKEELDTLKREYIAAYKIDTSDTDFFHIATNEEPLLVSVPAAEGAEIKELEFDVNEELCVTFKICTNMLGQIEKEKEKDPHYNDRFTRCHELLNTIKHKFIQERRLDETAMKKAGGMTVKCFGKPIMMELPSYINNVDYISPHELFGDAFKDPPNGYTPEEHVPTEPVPEDHQKPHKHSPAEEKHEGNVKSDTETTKVVKGTSSKAVTEKSNIILYVLVIFVCVILM